MREAGFVSAAMENQRVPPELITGAVNMHAHLSVVTCVTFDFVVAEPVINTVVRQDAPPCALMGTPLSSNHSSPERNRPNPASAPKVFVAANPWSKSVKSERENFMVSSEKVRRGFRPS